MALQAVTLAKELLKEPMFRRQLFAGLVLMAMAAPITAWLFDNEHPVEFDGEKSLVIPNEASGGEQMLVLWKLKRPPRKGCEGDVRRILVDPSTKTIITAYDRERSTAGETFSDGYLRKTFTLPKAMPRGWTIYKSDLCYTCNPLQRLFAAQRICYSTPELYFKVL